MCRRKREEGKRKTRKRKRWLPHILSFLFENNTIIRHMDYCRRLLTLLPACALAATACRLQSCLLSLKNLKNKLILSLIWWEYPEASYCTQNKIQMPFPGVHSPTGQGSSSPFQPQGFVLAVPFAWNVLPLTIHKAWLLLVTPSRFHVTSSARSSLSDSSSFFSVNTTDFACIALSSCIFLLWLFVYISPLCISF